jgi:hypothetical protein
VLDLPHPLFANGIDLQGVGGSALNPKEYVGAEQKDKQRYEQRNDGPGKLQGEIAVILLGLLIVGTPPVFDGKNSNHPKDENTKYDRQED